jgi:release factor glutamine methyltransferase
MSVEKRIAAILERAGITGAADEAPQLAAAARVRGGSEAQALELAAQRAGGTPLAYLIGRQKFMGVELEVNPGVLVPRQETELLGRTAARVLGATQDPRAIDMCCGAGNLACAIAHELPQSTFWATDLTDSCVQMTRQNVRALGLEKRVHVHQGDLFAGLAGLGLEGTIDAVICNPPYISTGRLGKDRATLLDHEPREAFDGGAFGLSLHQRVIKDAPPYLKPGGWLLFEIGLGQDRQVKLLFERARSYEDAQMEHDAQGNPRVIYARRHVDAIA